MKPFLIFFSFLFPPSFNLLFAQAPSIQWEKKYGGDNVDNAKCIQQTSDGGYIVVGNSRSNNGDVSGNHGGEYDCWVTKLSAAGNIAWQKCYGGSGDDQANSVQQTNDGGYIIAGSTTSFDGDVTDHHQPANEFNGFLDDFWIIKITSAGNLEWQKCLGGSLKDIAYSIQQTTDGGYIVAGSTYSRDGDVTGFHVNDRNIDANDFWVVKLSATGSLQWQRAYGARSYEVAYSIKQTKDGGYIVAGYTTSENGGDVSGSHVQINRPINAVEYADCWIVKLDVNGIIEWQKCLGGTLNEVAYSIIQATDGGYAIAGYAESTDGDVTEHISGTSTLWVVRLNNSGDLIWQKCFSIGTYNQGKEIQQTSDGGYIIAGTTTFVIDARNRTFDIELLKLDDKGILQWQKSLGGDGEDNSSSVKQTSDDGYIVAGYSNSVIGDITNNKGGFDYLVIKLAPTPCVASIMATASSVNICSGSPITFTASILNGGNNPVYQWKINGNNVGTNSSSFITTALNNNDTVNCILTSDAYCALKLNAASNAIVVSVTSVLQPAITINSATTTICSGTAITFAATSTNGGNNPVYQWTKNGKNVGSNNSTYTDNMLNNADTINCILISNNLCAAPAIATSNSIIITVNPIVNPSVSITSSANNICPGTAVTFTAAAFNGGSSPSYQWKKNGINVGTNSPTLSYTSIANGDVFSCIINSNAICSSSPAASSNNIVISVQSLPGKVNLGNDTTICFGNNITLKASPGFISYLWQDSSTSSSLIITPPGIYSVTATDACGNASSDTINAFVFPFINNFLPKDTAICSNATLVLKPITSFKNYLWNNNSTSSFININSPGLYWLQVIDNNNCTSRDSIIISPKACFEAVNIPNTFTPNNDGINDTWVIKNLENYSSCTVQVFNRNGQLIFESKGYPKPWDGTMNGRSLPFGTYYYIIEAGTGLKPVTGYVTLLK